MKLNKTNMMLAGLLMGVSLTLSPMDQPPKKPGKVKRVRQWVTSRWGNLAGSILLGETRVGNLQSQLNITGDSFPFMQLPEDTRREIILLLSLNATAASTGSLMNAAYTINSLSQVNKELNALINNPQFCLQVIKHFSSIFDCSNEQACSALQTQEAKRRLQLQNELKLACTNPSYRINFEELYNNGLDINFTYEDNKTPLILAAENTCFPAIDFLLSKIDEIDINHRGNNGSTAFMACLIAGSVKRNQMPYALIIHQLLTNKANPNIPGQDGITYDEIVEALDSNSPILSILKEFELIKK